MSHHSNFTQLENGCFSSHVETIDVLVFLSLIIVRLRLCSIVFSEVVTELHVRELLCHFCSFNVAENAHTMFQVSPVPLHQRGICYVIMQY